MSSLTASAEADSGVASRLLAGLTAALDDLGDTGQIHRRGVRQDERSFERRSGVGAYGGDYQELMQRSLNQIGEDVAHMLREF